MNSSDIKMIFAGIYIIISGFFAVLAYATDEKVMSVFILVIMTISYFKKE